MKLIADLHTHTVACGHGFSTVQENVFAAQKAGLSVLGITEHGPSIPGGPHHYLMGAMLQIPPSVGNLRILRGAELNIINTSGELDLDRDRMSRLDIVLAAIHPGTPYDGKSQEEHTRALCAAMENPYLDILAHPDNPGYALDYKKIVRKAMAEGVLLEVNNNSMNPTHPGRKNGLANCQEFLTIGKKEGLRVTVGSDAHISFSVGKMEKAIKLLEEIGYPEELILNCSREGIEDFLEERQKRIQKKLKTEPFWN